MKKYQVFVSSTYRDLVEERKEVTQALLENNCIPAGMELFPATDKKQWEIIKKVINESDYYLLIIAGRYGTIGINEHGNKVSYTEMEYDYALEIKKPMVVLIHDEVGKIPSDKTEDTKAGKSRLEKFRKKVSQIRLIKYWNNKDNLKSAAINGITAIISDFPTNGWTKGNFIETSNESREFEFVKAYETRQAMNRDCNKALVSVNHNLDIIAFGLRSFRDSKDELIEEKLKQGVNIRILTMDIADEGFLAQREKEENEPQGQIKNTILTLIDWCKKKNDQNYSGKIKLRAYNCMTLNYYCRIDDEVLFVGPYWYGVSSQQTLSYQHKEGSCYKRYVKYFETLWNDEKLTRNLLNN